MRRPRLHSLSARRIVASPAKAQTRHAVRNILHILHNDRLFLPSVDRRVLVKIRAVHFGMRLR
jgi:hypothetical protein